MNKKTAALLAAGLLSLFLAACSAAPVPTEPTEPPVERLAMVLTAEEMDSLEDYPALKELDLTGSTCYSQIEAYQQLHPEVNVIYTVQLGSRSLTPDTESLTLSPGDCPPETLLEAVPHLPKLKQLSLPDTDLTPAQLAALREAVPGLELTCTMELLGQPLSTETESISLAGLEPEQVPEAAEMLALFPNITQVELMDEQDRSALAVSDVALLQQALPDTEFHYSFTLFGKTVSTTDESIEYVNKKIGDSGEEELRQALDILKGCKYLKLESCSITNPVMEQLREDYRDRMKVVWRIYFARHGSTLTDRTVLRYVYNLSNSNCSDLRYCEDVEYIDFGHNESLTDISWIASMPKLKAVILSGSLIDDLTPFENCPDLEFLEIAYCSRISDLSPLKNCKKLIMLNTSYTAVEDLSPVDELPMERLCSVSSKVPEEEQERYQSSHPDTLTLFRGTQPYGYCWRYHEDGRTPTDYYAHLKDVFHYPNPFETFW